MEKRRRFEISAAPCRAASFRGKIGIMENFDEESLRALGGSRVYDNGAFYTVRVTGPTVHAWARRWPGFGSYPSSGFLFQFDKRNGDLVDLTTGKGGDTEKYDGSGLVALSHDAQEFGRRRLEKKGASASKVPAPMRLTNRTGGGRVGLLKEPRGPSRFGQEKTLADMRARIAWEIWAAEKARQEGHEDLARGHDNARLDYESLLAAHSRYVVTRMKGDPKVPARYRQSGWMAFDTLHKRHGSVWPTRAEAEAEANVLSRASFMSRAG